MTKNMNDAKRSGSSFFKKDHLWYFSNMGNSLFILSVIYVRVYVCTESA